MVAELEASDWHAAANGHGRGQPLARGEANHDANQRFFGQSQLNLSTVGHSPPLYPASVHNWQNVAVTEQLEPGWWTIEHAARYLGLHKETVRKWTVGNSPRVLYKVVRVGQRDRKLVAVEDIEREARIRQSFQDRLPAPVPVVATVDPRPGPSELLDRNAVLEEVLRRRRIIDGHYEEIDGLRGSIDRQRREIEDLLDSPFRVPNP